MRNSLKQNDDGLSLPVTSLGTNPADFPVGSIESRAAARAMLQAVGEQRPTIFLWMRPERAAEMRRKIEESNRSLPGGAGRGPFIKLVIEEVESEEQERLEAGPGFEEKWIKFLRASCVYPPTGGYLGSGGLNEEKERSL